MNEEYITGYQYNPETGEYRGEYKFPNNKDKEEVHMPPNTTLTPPPGDVPSGLVPCWKDDAWVLKVDDDIVIKVQSIPAELYATLLPEFASDQMRFGLWTQSEYDAWELAYAAEQQRQELERQKAIVPLTTRTQPTPPQGASKNAA